MSEMKTVIVKFVVIALLLNVGTVAFFFVLDEFGMMEWDMMYAIPLGIVNGILLFIIQIKLEKHRRSEKEKESLR